MDAGINIALGTDSGVLRHDETGKEFYAMVRRGMTPLCWAELKTGQLANIVAVEGNPLDDIRVMESVVFVMKDGEIIKTD